MLSAVFKRLFGRSPPVKRSPVEKIVYIFACTQDNEVEFRSYACQTWERPAPDESWTDADARAWESRNPVWPLRDDLGPLYLDDDFVEVHFLATCGMTLEQLMHYALADEQDISLLRPKLPKGVTGLVLIDHSAFDGFDDQVSMMRSTSQAVYCGAYKTKL